jgi:hypothetical protein
MKVLILSAACLLTLMPAIRAGEPSANDLPDDYGMPFGLITDADVEHLFQFAKNSHSDFASDIERVYGDTIDKEALSRVFQFSLAFKSIDKDTRTYGQIIWSSLLNIGEGIGVEEYVRVIDKQTPEVQQRIRDFLYYPRTLAAKEVREETDRETREMYPTLFPVGFQFGRGDPLFASQSDAVVGYPTGRSISSVHGHCLGQPRRNLFSRARLRRYAR